jgi:outer membrane protein assembly factor BamB
MKVNEVRNPAVFLLGLLMVGGVALGQEDKPTEGNPKPGEPSLGLTPKPAPKKDEVPDLPLDEDSSKAAKRQAPDIHPMAPSALGKEVWGLVTLNNRWTLTPAKREGFELLPHERTKPVVVGDILYYGKLSGEVVALHRTLGYPLWKTKMPGSVEGALTYGRSKIFVGDNQGNFYSLNARDGSVAWKFKGQSEWLSPPCVARDKVFAMSSNDELWVLNETDGKEVWHYPRRGDEKMTIRGTSSPAVFAGQVFVGFSDGNLVALSAAEGTVLWVKKLRNRERFYDIDMSPHVDNEGVIAATFDGNLYRLDRNTGNILWSFRVGSYGGFLVEEDRVYFAGLNNNFYALNRLTGEVLWNTPYGQGVGLTPTRSGDYLVFSTSGDPVYVLDPKTGKPLSTERLGAGTLAAAVGHPDGYFYTLSNFGNLYAFEITKSPFPKKGPQTIPGPTALNFLAQSGRNKATP